MGNQTIQNKLVGAFMSCVGVFGVPSTVLADTDQRIFVSPHVVKTYGDDIHRIPEWVGDTMNVIVFARADFSLNGASVHGLRQYVENNLGIDISNADPVRMDALRDYINAGGTGAMRLDIETAADEKTPICIITAGADMGDHTYDLVSMFSSIPDYFLHGNFGGVEEWRWAFMVHEISHCNFEPKVNKFDVMGAIRSESQADRATMQIIRDELLAGGGLFQTHELPGYYRMARAVSAMHKNGIEHTTNYALHDDFDAANFGDNLNDYFSNMVQARQIIAWNVLNYLPRDMDAINTAFDYAWTMYAKATSPLAVRHDPTSIIYQPDTVRDDAQTLSFGEFYDKYAHDHMELVRTFGRRYVDTMRNQTDRPDVLAAYYQAALNMETNDPYVAALRDDYILGIQTFFPSLANMYDTRSNIGIIRREPN